MSQPTSYFLQSALPGPSRGRIVRAAVVVAAVVIGWFLIGLHTIYIRHFLKEAVPQPPASLAAEAVVLPDYLELDAFVWVRYAQDMAADGAWRLREADFDNAPHGRAVYWNSGLAWMLCALGQARQYLERELSASDAIAVAAPFFNPILFAIALGVVGTLVARGWSVGAAAALAVVLPMLPRVIWDFSYSRVDHHGQHLFITLLWLLAGVAGCSTRGERARRMWFVISGIAAGAGCWVGATQQMAMLGLFCGGAAVEILLRRRSKKGGQTPLPWVVWGAAGAVSALAFFLLENVPDRLFSLRLEVNHPAYALSLFCAGAFLKALDNSFAQRRVDPVLIPTAAAALLPGILIAVLGPAAHSLQNDYMARAHEVITEFRSVFATPGETPLAAFVSRVGIAPLLLPVAAALMAASAFRGRTHAAYWLVLPVAVGLSGLAAMQIRWTGLASATAICFVALAAFPPQSARGGRRLLRVMALAVLTGTCVMWLAELDRRTRSIPGFSYAERGRSMAAMRNCALFLRIFGKDAGEDVVLLGFPDAAPWMAGHRAARVVGSYYWENVEGLRDTALVFASQPGGDPARILTQRGVTHVLSLGSKIFAEEMLWIAEGTRDPARLERTLAARLADGRPPPWLESVPLANVLQVGEVRLLLYRVKAHLLPGDGE